MYNPDAILRYAHDREAELVSDARACGVPQTDPKPLLSYASAPVIVLTVTILLAVAILLIVQ